MHRRRGVQYTLEDAHQRVTVCLKVHVKVAGKKTRWPIYNRSVSGVVSPLASGNTVVTVDETGRQTGVCAERTCLAGNKEAPASTETHRSDEL